jgi:hypothetical protein
LVFNFNFAKRLGFKSFCFHTIMMVVTCSNKITILKQTNVFWCFVMESMGSDKLKIGHYLILWYSNSRQNQLPISIITYFDSLSSILQRNLKNLSTSSLQMNSVDQVLNLFAKPHIPSFLKLSLDFYMKRIHPTHVLTEVNACLHAVFFATWFMKILIHSQLFQMDCLPMCV